MDGGHEHSEAPTLVLGQLRKGQLSACRHSGSWGEAPGEEGAPANGQAPPPAMTGSCWRGLPVPASPSEGHSLADVLVYEDPKGEPHINWLLNADPQKLREYTYIIVLSYLLVR